jgi:hypothetical protein
LPARRFNSRLKVHVEIKEITYGLREKLRLAETPGVPMASLITRAGGNPDLHGNFGERPAHCRDEER